jgi:serine/threonine protein kinase
MDDMSILSEELISMLKPKGYLFLEGHPPGYRGEPDKYLNPLVRSLKSKLSVLHNKTVTDRGLKRQFFVFTKAFSGTSSNVMIDGDTVTKQYHTGYEFEERSLEVHFINESRALVLLNHIKHFPTLKSIDFVNKTIVMDYCGERITKDNIPEDWQAQCFDINSAMTNAGMYNIDIKIENILVKDKIIHLIDFGLASRNSNEMVKKIEDVIKTILI